MKYILLISILFFSCNEEDVTSEKKTEKRTEVTTQTLLPTDIQDTLSFDARLVALHEIELVSRVSGTLSSVRKSSGKVTKGELLLEVEPALYSSNFNMANASFKMAEANYNQWKKKFKSFQELHASGDISDDDLKTYKVQFYNSEQQYYQMLNGKVNAKILRDNALLKAPFSGYFGNSDLVQGQHITIGDRFGTLADFSQLKVVLTLSLDEITRVKIGQRAVFHSSVAQLEGVVHSVSNVADKATGTYRVELRFKNDADTVRISGVFGKVTILGETYTDQLVVRQDYIQSEQGRYYLNCVSSGKVVKQPITRAFQIGNYTVLNNVSLHGKHYITSASNKIKEGAEVNVVPN